MLNQELWTMEYCTVIGIYSQMVLILCVAFSDCRVDLMDMYGFIEWFQACGGANLVYFRHKWGHYGGP